MKKTLTRILTLISMIIFVFSFAACGSNEDKAGSEVLEAYDSSEAASSTTTKSSEESSTLAEMQENADESDNAESTVTESVAASKKKSNQKQKTKKEVTSQADTSGQSANNSSTKAAAKSSTTKTTTKAAAQSTTKSTTQSTTKATTKPTTQSTTQPTTKATTKPTTKATAAEEDKNMFKIEIVVGNKSFSATLYDNAAAKALLEMLPMTLNMSELNGNEKYYYLTNSLPTNSSVPSGIEAGDIMLYGNNCLVLFYESFSTSYSYTPLGRIDAPKGLAEALGSGSVQVTFRKG